MTSHCSTLLSTSPQLMPGISLSLCMALSCLPRRPAAADLDILGIIFFVVLWSEVQRVGSDGGGVLGGSGFGIGLKRLGEGGPERVFMVF